MVVNICLNGGHPQFYDLAISFNKVWDLWQATCLNFTWEGLSCTLIFHDFPCIGRMESPSIPAIWHSHGGPCVDDLPIQKNGRRFPLQFAMSNWFKLDSRCWLKWSALATALHFLSWLPSLNSIDEVETAWKVYQWSELESSLTMVSNFMIHLSGSSCGKHFPIRASLCGSLWICFKSLSAVGHWKHCAHFVLIIHQVSICGWTLENFSYFKL